ncbi:MAG: sirohydrochlorin nickelochelatase [Candidatus Bathyarchaeota archaeon]|nr:sirohydrochlorin nickelochelatase [Candidatus Bathyarchaeota archaeon]
MENVGLVLIGHGSKLPHNQENLEKLAAILKKRSNFTAVEICFMVKNTPTIPEAIDSIAAKGVKKVVLIPAFLAPGVHTTQEIPELIATKAKESQISDKGIQLIYGEPIGADERIAEILEEKALRAIGKKIRETAQTPYGADAPTASRQMYEESMKFIRPEIKEILNNAPKNHAAVIERVVHTTADPEFAKGIVISDGAVEAGVAAITAGAKVVTDVKMVKAGITEARLKKFGGKILTYIDDKRATTIAKDESVTRSVAATRLAVEEGLDGAIFLIGNAPTAAFELAKAVKQGKAKPALIVATPVGYVGAAESKVTVSKLPVPFIIVKGRKGGSPLAVAVFNALLAMAEAETQKGT